MREADLADLRQSAEELSTAVADSMALVERIRLLQEELTALLNEQTNQTQFIPDRGHRAGAAVTIIPGLFGMNVRGIPFAERASAFWMVLLLVIGVVAAGVVVLWTRRIGR
jgi:zinc transporter